MTDDIFRCYSIPFINDDALPQVLQTLTQSTNIATLINLSLTCLD